MHFSIAAYADFLDCDVVPMQACSLLLCSPWKFDKKSVHYGSTNQYTLVHIDKKIALLPMSPEQILKDDIARASKSKKQEQQKSENEIMGKEFVQQHKTNNVPSNNVATEIKLTNPCLLASKSDITDLDVNTYVCYAIVCKEVLFSFEDMPPSLPLLLIKFCMSLRMFFQVLYHRDYNPFEE